MATTNSTLGTRKRAALGDLTNANRARATAGVARTTAASGKEGVATRLTKTTASAAGTSKVPRAESSTTAGKRLATRSNDDDARSTRVVRRAVTSNGTGAANTRAAVATSIPSRSNASSRTDAAAARRVRSTKQADEEANGNGDADRENKRIKVGEHDVADDDAGDAHQAMAEQGFKAEDNDVVPKDAGWEDLDTEDADDPLMVAEYVNEIFAYMKEIEVGRLSGDGDVHL